MLLIILWLLPRRSKTSRWEPQGVAAAGHAEPAVASKLGPAAGILWLTGIGGIDIVIHSITK